MAKLFSYSIPFQKPLITGSGSYTERTGWILSVDENGLSFLTEISPLSGFSPDTPGSVQKALNDEFENIDSFLRSRFDIQELHHFLKSIPELPSLKFGLTTLAAELMSYRSGQTFAELLQLPQQPVIRANATIGAGSLQETSERLAELVNAGFNTFKLKAAGTLEPALNTIRFLSDQYPNCLFRIDANGSLSEKEFRNSFETMEQLPIEYIEEPVRFHSPDELNRWIEKSPVAVAADESVSRTENLKNWMSEAPDAIFVIKPALFGSIFEMAETIGSNRSSCRDVIITTTLESAVGRRSVALSASVLGDPNRAHGLSTGSLFESDLLPDDQTTGPEINSESLSKSAGIDKLNRHFLRPPS